MKHVLWTSALALTAAVCITACGDSSSDSSYEIPNYKDATVLPDSCTLEVAQVDTAYYACFENKWVEVTDSATIEMLKEGLDEEEIKAKLEELEDLLAKSSSSKKPTSSSATAEEPDDSGDDDNGSDSDDSGDSGSGDVKEGSGASGDSDDDEEEEEKEKEKKSSSSAASEDTKEKCGDQTYDPATQYCADGTTPKDLSKCGDAEKKSLYNPETHYCSSKGAVTKKIACGEAEDAPLYDPETEYCKDGNVKLIMFSASSKNNFIVINGSMTVSIADATTCTIDYDNKDYVGVTDGENCSWTFTNINTGTNTKIVTIYLNSVDYGSGAITPRSVKKMIAVLGSNYGRADEFAFLDDYVTWYSHKETTISQTTIARTNYSNGCDKLILAVETELSDYECTTDKTKTTCQISKESGDLHKIYTIVFSTDKAGYCEPMTSVKLGE